ncbi:MAG: demethylmenaquinone methyltransferase [Bacillota bacterium]
MKKIEQDLISKSDYIHQVFESIADNYDLMNHIISLGLDGLWRKKAISLIEIETEAKILDVACGTCEGAVMLAHKLTGQGQIIGVDFSKKMLRIGEEKLQMKGLNGKVKLIKADARELPFLEEKFDYVTISFALRNIPELKQVLLESKRVVKPGGTVISLDIFKPTLIGYRQLVLFYINKLVPLLGKIIVNKQRQYNWLPHSLEQFVTVKELEDIFKELGFRQVKSKRLIGGIVAVHYGEK